MKLTTILCVTLAALFVSASANAQVPKEVKEKLFARYDKQNVNVVHDKILVTALGELGSGNTSAYAVAYDHFSPALSREVWQKDYKRNNLLDEQTVEEVQLPAGFTDPLTMGEMLQVSKFYVTEGKQNRTLINLYLVALDGKRVGRMQNIYNGVPGFVYKGAFGFRFQFIFPPLGPDANATFADIVKEIGQYLVPPAEYQQKIRSAAEAAEGRKNIDIQPGMSKEDIVKMMGEPVKSITFGKRTTLTYKEVTITLEDNKVVDVKPN